MLHLLRSGLAALLLMAFYSTAATAAEKSDEQKMSEKQKMTLKLLHNRGALDEFDNLALLDSTSTNPLRLVLGDEHGFVHVYEQRDEAFAEVWTSEYFEGAISHLFVVDINDDDLEEIVVVIDQGRFYYLDTQAYNTLWSNPPSEYERITALLVHNIDEDPQPELIFCADGHLIIYDGREQFEEWRSEQDNLEATEILIADVDGDEVDEIVLNSGYVFDARFHDLEWQSPEPFGQRMGFLDIDDDGILEVIGEFGQHSIRIFDIDLRREKSPRR